MNTELANNWILEITYQDRNLSMSLFDREHTLPLKAVCTIAVDLPRIERHNNEIITIINRASKKRTLDNDSITELKKNARILYDLLFSREVKEQLSNLGSVYPVRKISSNHTGLSNGVNLFLSLDERLIGILWELVYDGNDFFCLKFNVGRSVRTQRFPTPPRYRSISTKPRMLILANPTGDLRSAYQEGLYIKNRLTKRGKISLDFKAQDIDSNYVRKNLRDYDIIHFAGHCEYSIKNPNESGWVLSDGWISAREFIALGENASLPNIIFANACQSARISNDLIDTRAQGNIYGLAQAFLFAGARHYLGSFWRVEDNYGGEFAEEFYDQIANGYSIGVAVRLARLKLFNHYGITAIAWAGYVLYGDPGFSPFKPLRAHQVVASRRLKRPAIKKKSVIVLGLGLLIFIFGILLNRTLSTLNPHTLILFTKAKQLYEGGRNAITIESLERIIKQDLLFLPAWRLRGDVYFRLGKFSDALSNYFDYARLSERIGDYKHLASAYVKIAWTYHMWGDYQRSKEFYDKGINLSRSHDDKLNEADAMGRLAVWYIDKGDSEAAFSLLMKSSEINRQRSSNPEHRFNLACDYFNIGFLYTDKDDFSTAKEFFNKSKGIFESLGAIPELSDYYFDMGEIALFEKNYDSALEFYQKGLALDRKLNHRFNLSSDYWMLGELYWEMGKFTEAENYFKEALFISNEIDNKPVLAGVYYDLGLMYKERDDREKAKEYLSLALKLYKEIDTPDYQEVQQEYLALE